MKALSHFDNEGKARMVDISEKTDTVREAIARGSVTMRRETLELIAQGAVGKGDVLGVARVAGIMAAKRTAEIIPMCHPLQLTGVTCNFVLNFDCNCVLIEARVKTTGKTGVEMEALTVVSTAALTVYDMCKAVDREMIIGDIRLVKKSGGKSGTFLRKGEEEWDVDQ